MAQIATTSAPAAQRRNYSSLIVGVLLILVFSPLIISIVTQVIARPSLFAEQLKVGLVNGAIVAIIALGYTLVYGIIELINFAHGEVYMLGAFSTLILFVVMAITAGINVSIERLAYRRLRNAPRLAPLISAIGVSFILQNVGLLLGGMSILQGDYWALVALIAPAVVAVVAILAARRIRAGRATPIPWWGWLLLMIVAVALAVAGFNMMHTTLQSAAPIKVGASIMGNTAPGAKSIPEVLV